MSIESRFFAKVTQSGNCWLWVGAKHEDGYGQFWNGRRQVKAHRWVYERLVGPIPDGLQIDHLCRNPSCVNPQHLEPVTQAENIRRGAAPSTVARRTGMCSKGHSLDDAYVRPSGGRECRMCRRETERKRSARSRAADIGGPL
jgi:hypothetical protein